MTGGTAAARRRCGLGVALGALALLVAAPQPGQTQALEITTIVAMRPSPLPVHYAAGHPFHEGLLSLPDGGLEIAFLDVLLPAETSPLFLRRTYHSREDAGGILGPGWLTNLDTVLEPGDVPRIREADGGVTTYNRVDEAFAPESPNVPHALELRDDGVYVRTWADGTVELFDEQGRLTRHAAGGDVVTYFYDDPIAPGPVRAVDYLGRTLELSYAGGRLVGVADPLGRTIRYGYRDDRLSSVTDALGRETTFAYAEGRLAAVILPRGSKLAFSYGPDGGLAAIAGPGTARTDVLLQRDDDGQVTEAILRDANGHARFIELGGARLDPDEWGAIAPDLLPWQRDVGFMRTVADETGVETRLLRTPDALAGSTEGSAPVGSVGVADDPLWPAAFVPNAVSIADAGFRFDDIGRPVAHAADGHELRFTWDDADRVTRVAEEGGLATEILYDAHDNPVEVVVDGRSVLAIAYDAADRAREITDKHGRSTVLSYDRAGNLVRAVEYDGTTWGYAYDVADRLTAVDMPDFGRFELTYDAQGRPMRLDGPAGRTRSYAYDDEDRLVAETDQGVLTRYLVYDRDGRTASVLDPDVGWIQFAYDEDGRTTLVEGDGFAVRYGYDDQGRLVDIAPSAGPGQRLAYSADGRLTRIEGGNTTLAVEDRLDGGCTVAFSAGGVTEALAYAADGRLLWSDGPDGRTDLDYDATGEVAAVRTATGLSLEITRDAWGRPVASTATGDGRTATVAYGYDADGNLVMRRAEDGAVDRFAYDDLGRLNTATDGHGAEFRYGYDAAGQLASFDGPDGRWSWTYDEAGRVTSETAPGTGTYITEYDGGVERIIDPEDNSTTIAYEPGIMTVTDPLGGVTVSEYDALGNLVALTDPEGHVAHWRYDAMGRPVGADVDGLLALTMEYDANGYTVESVFGNGHTVLVDYADGRAVKETWGDATTRAYVYDGAGRLVAASDDDGSYGYAYDAFDRLVAYSDPWGGAAGFAYDDAGRLAGIDVAGHSLAMTHAPGGAPAAVASGPHRADYDVDPAGRMVGIAYANGVKAEVEYNASGQLTAMRYRDAAGQVLYEELLGYDPRGLVASRQHDGAMTTFRYDAVGRLVAAEGAEPARFTYDGTGNVTATANVADWAYGDANLLTQWNGTPVESDEAGNVSAADGIGAFAYRHGDRLSAAVVGGAETTFDHDPSGRVVRAGRSGASGAASEHVIRVGPYRLASLSEGSPDVIYAPGPDPARWAFVLVDRAAYYPLWSSVGNLIALTDASGAVVKRYVYDVYGRVLTETDGPPVPAHFHGRPYDPATSLYDFGARFYSPELTRFLTPDPLGPDEVGNRYAFASGNPLAFTDASGLMSVPAGTVAPTPLAEPWRVVTPGSVARELGRLQRAPGATGAVAREALVTLATREGTIAGPAGRGFVGPGTGGQYFPGTIDAHFYPDNLYARAGGDLRQTLRAAAGVTAHELDHVRVFNSIPQGGAIRRYNLLHEYSARLRQWHIDPYLGQGRTGRVPLTPAQVVNDTAAVYGRHGVRGATEAYYPRPYRGSWQVGRIPLNQLDELAVYQGPSRPVTAEVSRLRGLRDANRTIGQQINRPIKAQVNRLRGLRNANLASAPRPALAPARPGAVRQAIGSAAGRARVGLAQTGSTLGRGLAPLASRLPGAGFGAVVSAGVSYYTTGKIDVLDVAKGALYGAFPIFAVAEIGGMLATELGYRIGEELALFYLSITGGLDSVRFEIENADALFGPLGQEMAEFRAGWTPGPLYVHPDLVGKGFDSVLDEIEDGIDPAMANLLRAAQEEAEAADYELGQLEAILEDLRGRGQPAAGVQGLTVTPSLPEVSVADQIREAIGLRDGQLEEIRTILSDTTSRPWSLTMDPQSRLRAGPAQ